MKKRRSTKEIITRMATLAVLSALGFVFMAFVQIPYPFAPWLKIEISEIITLIAYALYGLPGGISVAVIKTLLNLAVHGPVGLGIGDLTAFITSCTFIFGLFLTSHIFKWFKKGLLFRILGYLVITMIVTATLTLLNAIVITPSYLTVFGENPRFSTCFEPGVIQSVFKYLTGKSDVAVNGWTYVGAICAIYVPFNLMKAAGCCLIYELLFNRLIFVFMRKSPLIEKYFIGDIFHSKEEENKESTIVEEKDNNTEEEQKKS